MGKGSKRRPTLINRDEECLRWNLYQGLITKEEFDRALEKIRKGNNGKN